MDIPKVIIKLIPAFTCWVLSFIQVDFLMQTRRDSLYLNINPTGLNYNMDLSGFAICVVFLSFLLGLYCFYKRESTQAPLLWAMGLSALLPFSVLQRIWNEYYGELSSFLSTGNTYSPVLGLNFDELSLGLMAACLLLPVIVVITHLVFEKKEKTELVSASVLDAVV